MGHLLIKHRLRLAICISLATLAIQSTAYAPPNLFNCIRWLASSSYRAEVHQNRQRTKLTRQVKTHKPDFVPLESSQAALIRTAKDELDEREVLSSRGGIAYRLMLLKSDGRVYQSAVASGGLSDSERNWFTADGKGYENVVTLFRRAIKSVPNWSNEVSMISATVLRMRGPKNTYLEMSRRIAVELGEVAREMGADVTVGVNEYLYSVTRTMRCDVGSENAKLFPFQFFPYAQPKKVTKFLPRFQGLKTPVIDDDGRLIEEFEIPPEMKVQARDGESKLILSGKIPTEFNGRQVYAIVRKERLLFGTVGVQDEILQYIHIYKPE